MFYSTNVFFFKNHFDSLPNSPDLYIGCLHIFVTHVTANNSTIKVWFGFMAYQPS